MYRVRRRKERDPWLLFGVWLVALGGGDGGLDADGLEEGRYGGVALGELHSLGDDGLEAVLAQFDLGHGVLGGVEGSGELDVLVGEEGDPGGECREEGGHPDQQRVTLHEV